VWLERHQFLLLWFTVRDSADPDCCASSEFCGFIWKHWGDPESNTGYPVSYCLWGPVANGPLKSEREREREREREKERERRERKKEILSRLSGTREHSVCKCSRELPFPTSTVWIIYKNNRGCSAIFTDNVG
jgi:hypothetical protein